MLFVVYNGSIPTVTLASGAPVGTPTPPGTLIPAGTYTVQISVASGPADFQIVGPGVSFLDNEPSTEVYALTFAPSSTYSYEDVSDPSATLGYFSTTSTLAPTTTVAPPTLSSSSESNSDVVGSAVTAVQKPAELEATVTRAEATSLTEGGRAVARLEAGRYTFLVGAAVAKTSFYLEERGHAPIALSAGPSAKPHSVTLTLGAGTWFYYATPAHKSTFVVAAAA